MLVRTWLMRHELVRAGTSGDQRRLVGVTFAQRAHLRCAGAGSLAGCATCGTNLSATRPSPPRDARSVHRRRQFHP